MVSLSPVGGVRQAGRLFALFLDVGRLSREGKRASEDEQTELNYHSLILYPGWLLTAFDLALFDSESLILRAGRIAMCRSLRGIRPHCSEPRGLHQKVVALREVSCFAGGRAVISGGSLRGASHLQ